MIVTTEWILPYVFQHATESRKKSTHANRALQRTTTQLKLTFDLAEFPRKPAQYRLGAKFVWNLCLDSEIDAWIARINISRYEEIEIFHDDGGIRNGSEDEGYGEGVSGFFGRCGRFNF